MKKKMYIAPETEIVEVELESLVLGNSIIGDGGEGSQPSPDGPYGGDAASKGENNSGDIWDDEW